MISDATATFNKKGIDGKNFSADLIHETALASLNEEFATIITTEFIKNIIQNYSELIFKMNKIRTGNY